MNTRDLEKKHVEDEIAPTTVVQDVQTPSSSPPDGGYGWVCIGSAFCINGLTWGIVASYGVYLNYYLDNNIFPGVSQIGYTFIGGANFAAALVSAPAVNALLRKFGTHPVMYTGCVVWLVGWIAASFAKTVWQLVLSQGVCIGLGLGFIWQPSAGIVSQWFLKRRSLAQGISSAGSGFIGLIYSLSIIPMIDRLGLSWSLRIIGISSFFALLVTTYLIRDRNKVIRPKVHPFDVQLLKQYQVWLVLGWSFFTLLGYIVLLYSLGNYGATLGLSQYQGGIIITMLNIGTFLGRLFIGAISDRFGRVTMACALTGSSAFMTFAWWINTRNYGSLLALALVVGMIFGTYVCPRGAVPALTILQVLGDYCANLGGSRRFARSAVTAIARLVDRHNSYSSLSSGRPRATDSKQRATLHIRPGLHRSVLHHWRVFSIGA